MTAPFQQMHWWQRLEAMSQAGAIPKGQYGATLDLATAPWSVAALPQQQPQAPQQNLAQVSAQNPMDLRALEATQNQIAAPQAVGEAPEEESLASQLFGFGEPVFNALAWAYRELSTEVLSPATHIVPTIFDPTWHRKIGADGTWDAVMDGRTWKEIWRIGEKDSFGRGLATNVMVLGGALDPMNLDKPVDIAGSLKAHKEGVADSDSFYNKFFNVYSGGMDFMGVMFLDPLWVGGKYVASSRLLRTTKKSKPAIAQADDFDQIMDAEPVARWLNWTDGRSADEIVKHPAIAGTPHAGLIADLMSKASMKDKDLIYRVSLGDAKAFGELQSTAPAIAAQYVRMKGQHRFYELEVLPTLGLPKAERKAIRKGLKEDRKAFKDTNRTQLKLAETEFIPEGMPFSPRWLPHGDPLVHNTYATVYKRLGGNERQLFSPSGAVERTVDDVDAAARQYRDFRKAGQDLAARLDEKAPGKLRKQAKRHLAPRLGDLPGRTLTGEVVGRRKISGMPKIDDLRAQGPQQAQSPRLFDDLDAYNPAPASEFAARMSQQLDLLDDWVAPELADLNSRAAFFTRVSELADDVAVTPTKTGIFGSVTELPKGGVYATIAERKAELGTKMAMVTQRRKFGALWQVGWASRPVYVLNDLKEGLTRGNTPTTFSAGNPEGWRTIDAWLKRVRGLPPETRMEWVRKFMGATNEQEKLAHLEAMEGTIVKHLLKVHGVKDDATIEQIVANTMGSKKAIFGRMADEAKAAAEKGSPRAKGGRTYNAVKPATLAADGTALVPGPQLVKQLMNEHPLLDVELLDKAFRRDRTVLQSLLPGPKLKDPVMELATWTGRIWKLSVLARVGFAVRTVSDEVMLAASALGSWMYMAGAIPGAARLFGEFGGATLKSAAHYGKKIPGAGRALDGLPSQESNIAKRVKNRRAVNRRELPEHELNPRPYQRGIKPVEVSPGVFAHGIYDGPTGSVTKALTSADQRNMFGIHDDLLTMLRTKMNQGALNPKDPKQELSWLKAAQHALNHQLGRDVVARKFLRGETEEEVLAWTRTAQGRNYLKQMGPLVQANREDWLRGVAAMVDQYTLGDPDLMRLALEGKVTTKQLKTIPIDKRMPVHGGQIDHALAKGELSELLNNMATGFYGIASKLPTDALVRHPVADLMYQSKLRELVAIQEAQGVSMRARPDRLYQLEETARQFTVKEMDRIFKDNLFSSPQTALKFAMPFFGAWRASIARWATQVGENPWIVARASQGWQGLHKPFDVVDEDGIPLEEQRVDDKGNRVDEWLVDKDGNRTKNPAWDKAKRRNTDEEIYGSDSKYKIAARIPERMAKMLGALPLIPEGTEQYAPGREIPLRSFNTVLQGDPWYNPGFGPFVTVPISQIVQGRKAYGVVPSEWFGIEEGQADPKAAEFMQKAGVLPFGARDSWKDHALPTTWQRFVAEQEKKDSRAYVNAWYNIMRVEEARYQRHERKKPPTLKEIYEKTDNLSRLRFFEALLSPVSTQPMFYAKEWETKVPKEWQFLAAKFRDYKARFGNEQGEAIFFEEFPEAWLYMESTSKNNSGIPANHEAMAKARKFQHLASSASEIFDSAVGIEDHEYDKFDAAVYDAQMSSVWNPDTGQKFREVQDPATWASEAAKRRTWQDYSKVMNYLRAQLAERKLLTFNDPGAEDLKSKRKLVIDYLSEKDPAWGRAYGSPNPERAHRIREQAWLVANDQRLQTDPHRTAELQTLRSYLVVRDWFTKQLAARDLSGGSKQLDAQANRDLLEKWDAVRDYLAEKNTRFSELWLDRYFANDYIQESK